MRVTPFASASWTARLDGAEMAATTGIRATRAFCMISKLARPLTIRMCRSSGRPPGQQHVTDDLVDRVVPPHVLPHGQEPPGRVEQRRRVKAARPLEGLLSRGERGSERVQGVERDRDVAGDGLEVDVDGIQRGLAAHAAGGGREEAAVEALVDRGAGAVQEHVDHVPDPGIVVRPGVVGDHVDVGGTLDHALRQEQARDELLVVPGRPHGDDEALAAQPDLERLLDRELVFLGGGSLSVEAHHRVGHGGGAPRNVQLQLWLRGKESHVCCVDWPQDTRGAMASRHAAKPA